MATLFRVGVGLSRQLGNSSGFLSGKKDLLLCRTIISKAQLCDLDEMKRPAPYPYHDKKYPMWKTYFDRTSARLNENSKIIVIEGPVAAGKSKFAKELAADLDMQYLPEANLDMEYINDYGFDMRQLDDQLPESCKSFDVNNFLMNPKHRLVARFQCDQYRIKFSQYIDALAHLFSTGQGVVLDRCVYSDFVFVEAMYSQKYISKAAYKYYYDVRNNTIEELLRPHLVIYLDLPVKNIQAKINKRAIPYEKCSPVLTTEYLTKMEQIYKHKYLKQISEHSELLIYDWSEEGDTEVVVEDIERINFDKYDEQDPKMKDWDFSTEEDLAVKRRLYADKKNHLLTYFNVPTNRVPELNMSGEEALICYEVIDNAPGEKYAKGYNADLGDTGLLFKAKLPHRQTLPLRERRQPI